MGGCTSSGAHRSSLAGTVTVASGDRHTDNRSGSSTDLSSGGFAAAGAAAAAAAAAGSSVSDRFRGSSGLPALLKARSDMAVLRDLKIGPLLGQGQLWQGVQRWVAGVTHG